MKFGVIEENSQNSSQEYQEIVQQKFLPNLEICFSTLKNVANR
jgi:hypothetical protein